MRSIKLKTSKASEVIDITAKVQDAIERSGKKKGVCQLNLLHTTAALTVADLDPGTDKDYLDAFNEMVPDLDYRHPHNPSHVGDHIMSALIGTGLALQFEKRKLILGTWQSVVLIELDGPKDREIRLTLLD